MSGAIPDHGEILRRRGVDRIVYFHTDHFEPWQKRRDLSPGDLLDLNIARMQAFAERVPQRHFARRLTLHYLPEIAAVADKGQGLIGVDGDGLGIVPRTADQDARIRSGFAEVEGVHDFDFQVHFHHEGLTWNTDYSQRGPHRAHFAANDVALNRARFDIGLAEALRRIRQDTGRRLDRWFFVHGLWALNASDLDACSITDEIIRLKAAGALGDFTFPAGRPQCDPAFDAPALVRPFDGAKCYSEARADPRPAGSVPVADRFFIWSSRAANGDCSLDFATEAVAANFANVDAWAARLLLNGFQRDGTLYVKTHAHSQFPFYFTAESGRRGGMFPHERDEVARLIERFETAAGSVGGRVDYLHAGEVYDELTATTQAPAVYGYAATDLTLSRAAIDAADAAAMAVMAERIARDGAAAHGLDGTYEMLVGRGRAILPVEIEVANLVQRVFPPDRPIIHNRTAVGILPLAIALAGRRVTSVERMAKRLDVQQSILDRLETAHAGLKQRYALRRGTLVDMRIGAVRGACLLFTDASPPLSDAELLGVFALFDAAEMVLFDALRFGARRVGKDVPAFVDRLRGAIRAQVEPVLDLGDDGKYFLVDNRDRSRGQAPASQWRRLLGRLLGRA